MQSGLETHFPKQARFPDCFPDFLVLHNNKMSLFFEKILFPGSQPPLNSFHHHPPRAWADTSPVESQKP